MVDLPSLKLLLQAHGLLAKKSLGQHFLLDEHLLDIIASYAGDVRGQHVIEVGPGPGGLTRALLARGAHVSVVEKDERFAPLLAVLASAYPKQFSLNMADATRVDATELCPAPRQIISNLPYNVGTLLLMNWLMQIAEHGADAYTRLTLMFQKEVARRVMAEPDSKAYGRVSVLSQYLCDMEWHQDVPAAAFSPPPKVDSAVISLVPKAKRVMEVEVARLEKVVATAFNQRRKMLRQALKPLGDAEALLEAAGIDGTKRAENLSVEEFCRLASAPCIRG